MNPHLGMGDYYLEVARGYIPGAITVHKFGSAEDIDTADPPATVWDGCNDGLGISKIPQYTYSTTADIDTITSSDIGDAMDIEVQGLDANWDLTVQTITLNGQLEVLLPIPLIRVFRVKNVGSVDLVGDVYIRTTGSGAAAGLPTDPTSVRAIIHAEDNQTQMAIFTVPMGYSLFITHGWASIARKKDCAIIIKIYQRTFGGVFRILHTLALNVNGTCSDHRPYQVPFELPEKADIAYVVASVSANDAGVSAGFHGVLLPNGNR